MKRLSGFLKRRSVTLLLVVLSTFIALHIWADTITVDFEGYTLGTIDGQDGWSSDGAAGSGCAVYDHVVADPTTYGVGSFGSRSLRISNAVTSGCFGDQTFSKPLTDDAGESLASDAETGGLSGGTRQSYFEAEWDFASTVPGAEQPGLSTVASPDRGDGARMSWVQMTDTPAGLEVNFFDYQISAAPPTGAFVFTNVISGLDRTVPHHIKITMQFVDGPENDCVQVYVDGALLHTGTSWEDFFRQVQPPGTRTVDCVLFRTGGTAAPATAGFGFLIDNLRVFSGPVSDLALGKPAAALSSKPAHPPSFANDCNTDTHWRSGGPLTSGDKMWWRVDLGAVYSIDHVVIDWSGSFYAKQYKIQVSNTAAAGSWETVYTDNAGNGGIDDVMFTAADARYVRIMMTQHNEQVERLTEVQVYAASGSLSKESEVAKSEVVTDYALEQNYPNPFNPETEIRFALPEAGEVAVKIFNIAGQEVRTLANASFLAGRQTLRWDGRDQTGNVVAAGVYLYQIIASGENGEVKFTQTRRMAFVK